MRPIPLLLALAFVAVPLAGCASTTPAPTPSATPTASTSPSPSPSPSPTNPDVTLVTYKDFGLPQSVLDAFTNATGYKVSVVQEGDAVETLNKVILSADHPLGDALFGVDNALIYRAADHHVFDAYTPAAISTLNASLVAPFRVNGTLLATPFDAGYVELNADPAWFSAHNVSMPTDLAQIATPAYAKLTVAENPYTSTPGFAFLLATVDRFGTTGNYTYKDFWADFTKNGGKVTNDWGAAYGSTFTQGYDTAGSLDRPIVVSYSTSPAYNPMNGYGNATSVVLDLPKSAWFQVESIGVLHGAKNPAGAKALIDWLLTPDAQAKGSFGQVMYPVSPNATVPAEYALYAPRPAQPATLAPDVVEKDREAWLAGWRDATGAA